MTTEVVVRHQKYQNKCKTTFPESGNYIRNFHSEGRSSLLLRFYADFATQFGYYVFNDIQSQSAALVTVGGSHKHIEDAR
jgi:hypothetical protein